MSGLGRLLRPAHLALTFLTTLPLPHVREVGEGEFARASGFYPLAGYAVGGGAALVWAACQWLHLPPGVGAALAVAAWLALTGMLHFDGLVDAADALFVMKSPAERLRILGDVHVGAFGLATGVIALLIRFSLLQALPNAWPLLIAAVSARLAVLAPMNLYPAARTESLGARSREGWWPVACLVALPALFFSQAWAGFAAALLSALGVAAFAARRLGGGINGDVYGACIEVAELSALTVLITLAGWPK
ncbi:adenosylcobinamide-GDP ribazoletransferase (plasmid) [Deinococcus psychrotolerans]|uniref:Adenosylcobinamide-GDP ribazoletransferase n=1 Tax=Deinococcus psychrotolerans TaxID=2489213 RepID=A0A3G8YIE9_9DEIO|nr:adenosylcobinamide-GDP ribazoletransferase [Deinococcus psychrotolerans]AZI45022.1 adenosylcobinamide-GDP ribazoletransferase [Deinococcus psychrotolerans]